MQYRKLGNTGLKVSALSLGTGTYGSQVDEATAIDLIKGALAAGINFFDTADNYGGGKSEEIVGKALKGERPSVVLATKIGNRIGPSPNDRGLSRKHIMQGIEDSLRRLATDYVDLYYVHLPDYDTPLEETLRALDDLVHQGKVRYLGCSNFRAWQLCKALWVSDLRHWARFDCIQSPYNLIARDIEYELLPLCASEGVGVCAYNPLAGGLLTGKHDPDKPPTAGTRFTLERLGPMYLERYWLRPNFEAVARLGQIAREHGRSLPQFALAWVQGQPTITSAIFSATSPQHLKENLGALDVELSREELAACEGICEQLWPHRLFYGR